MGVRLTGMIHAMKAFKGFHNGSSKSSLRDVPKGHFAVYVGENQKRFVIPLSYLKDPSFQYLLDRAREEFGSHHGFPGITIPCREDAFIDLTSNLHDNL